MTPRVKILMRIAAVLVNPANDLEGKAGVANIKVRHTRNRWANPKEKPCLSIRLVSDEVMEAQDVSIYGEQRNDMQVDLQIDADLQTEDSDLDPTGLERLGSIGNAALMILKDQDGEVADADGNKLYDVLDEIVNLGVVPDEDSEGDEARFIHRISVLYRTSTRDPNVLLATGENLT